MISKGVQRYTEYLQGHEGRIKGLSLRYIGTLVSDFHRNLLAGGVFYYPADNKDPKNPHGKLRLLYECAPLSFIAEQAGGYASDGRQRILDIRCDRIAIIHNGEVKVAGIVGDIKREFNSEKGYVIELKRPETDLLERIYGIALVKKVIKTKDGSLPDTIQIVIKTETRESNGDVFQIIKEIVDMGGKICSFYEKEITLREMFSRVVEKK